MRGHGRKRSANTEQQRWQVGAAGCKDPQAGQWERADAERGRDGGLRLTTPGQQAGDQAGQPAYVCRT